MSPPDTPAAGDDTPAAGDENGARPPEPPEWEAVASLDELDDGALLQSMVGNIEIVLCRIGGQVFALDGWCSHADARLCEGSLHGYELQCPLHEGRFDVRNGRATCDPASVDVRTFPVRIAGNTVYSKVEGFGERPGRKQS